MEFNVVYILESFLGQNRGHNEDNSQVRFDCPECDCGEGKGNLEVNYEKGVYKCWSCQDTNNTHGPVIKLLKKYGNARIIRDYLLVKPESAIVGSKEYKEVVVTLPDEYKRLSDCTVKDFKYSEAIKYLYDRGITDEMIRDFNIGYCYRGHFFNRIIIPSYDSEGNLNYFVGRWFAKEKTKLKYLNFEAEKEQIIFNEYKINYDSTIYVVEGPTDHLVIPNSVPLLGKKLSLKLLEALHDNANAFVVICLDGDAQKNAIELFKQLNFGNLRGRVRVVFTPDGYDPSKIFEKLGASGIVKLLMSATVPSRNELD